MGFVCKICGENFHTIQSLAGHTGHCKRGHKTPLKNWEQYKDLEFYPDRTCACGCEGLIFVKECHKYEGIPKFIHGHNNRGIKQPHITERMLFNNPMKQQEVVTRSLNSRSGRKCSAESIIRISISHIGYKQTVEQRANESIAHLKQYEDPKELAKISGENNHNWLGGISFFPYPPDFNERLKESIRNRDDQICQLCGKTEQENGRKLDVHHIDYDKDNLEESNLISLCRPCHVKTNQNRDSWVEIFLGVNV